jgi:hypothetical protein
VLIIVAVGGVHAQNTAAVLDITYPGVSLRRVATGDWLTLPVGAIAPTGAGDGIRTDATGRALLTLTDGAELVLLPNGELTITALNTAPDGGVHVDLMLTAGEFALRAQPDTLHALRVNAPHTVTASAGDEPLHLLVRRSPSLTVLLMAEGTASLPDVPELATVTADSAALITAAGDEVHAVMNLQRPYSPAQAEGIVYGCPGVVQTSGGEDLNTRAGPSTSNPIYGIFPDGAAVQVMGVVASGGWYRVQYRSGFGWAQRLAIELEQDVVDCPVPTLPDDAFDIPNRVLNITPDEVALLLPFYGAARDDRLFYRAAP